MVNYAWGQIHTAILGSSNIDFAISRVEINKIKNLSHGSNLLQLFVKDPAVSMLFCLKIDGIVLWLDRGLDTCTRLFPRSESDSGVTWLAERDRTRILAMLYDTLCCIMNKTKQISVTFAWKPFSFSRFFK